MKRLDKSLVGGRKRVKEGGKTRDFRLDCGLPFSSFCSANLNPYNFTSGVHLKDILNILFDVFLAQTVI